MITLETAKDIVINHLKTELKTTLPFALFEQFTIEKPYGWIFFFNSKAYIETQDWDFKFFDTWPIVVERTLGRIFDLPGNIDPIIAISRFENAHALD